MNICVSPRCPYIAVTGSTLCAVHEAEAETGKQVGLASLGVIWCCVPGCGQRRSSVELDPVSGKSLDVCEEHGKFWRGTLEHAIEAEHFRKVASWFAVVGWSVAALALGLLWRVSS